MAETSTKPYMIRALYEWCCDNGYTPYLAVTVDGSTLVPRQHVQAGQIVLNVSPMATSRLTLGNELVEFQARFSGVAQQISVPIGNISAIYARETGHGMAFDVSAQEEHPEDAATVESDETADSTSGDDAGGERSPASSVHSLRSGPRRRGPHSIDAHNAAQGAAGSDSEVGDGQEADHVGLVEDGSSEGQAANSRTRAAKGQGSADVIEFAPAGGPRKKKGATRTDKSEDASANPTTRNGESGDDSDEPPPSDGGGSGRKGGKARLTRVK